MKKKMGIFLCAVIILLFFSFPVLANMAAPKDPDVGSTITFEKNDSITVTYEVLDIEVIGAKANIKASYHMKNTTNEAVTTKSMFLSPNISEDSFSVTIDGKNVFYTSQTYKIGYESEIATDDWMYIILKEDNEYNTSTVDTVLFELSFAPNAEHDVVVIYEYALGGYPDYDYDAKRGEILYYLKPAALWKDFEGLEINLILDKDMPVLKSSSVKFEKTGDRTFKYTSNELPNQDLTISIDQNGWQEFITQFKSPYIGMNLLLLIPIFIFIILAFIAVIIIAKKAVQKNKKKKENNMLN